MIDGVSCSIADALICFRKTQDATGKMIARNPSREKEQMLKMDCLNLTIF